MHPATSNRAAGLGLPICPNRNFSLVGGFLIAIRYFLTGPSLKEKFQASGRIDEAVLSFGLTINMVSNPF
jgi:hypothetical protein